MAVFVYAARSRAGERVEGTVEATDRYAALLHIERLGQTPIAVTERSAAAARAEPKKAHFTWSRRARMTAREVLTFTTELSDLLASGMTLGNALNCLANRKSGRPGDAIVAALRDGILQGDSLSDVMGQHPSSFPSLYASMIRAGEAGGALDTALRRLVEHYERVQQTKEKVVMALVYPCIVLVLGAATLAFSLVFVVPKFEALFRQLGQTLPLATRILIGASRWLARYGVFLAAGIALGVVFFRRAIRTEAGKLWWDGVLLRLPLIRGIMASSIFMNFARTLATLLQNGVPVLQALGIVERTVGNAVIARELRNAKERVTDGTTISGPLAASKVFPVIMTDMLAIGEQTGDMASALGHIARRYENDLDRSIKIFTTALEPILIVLVALAVGFVAVSILMAVFNLSSGLNV
jgi:type II secretory pathway component PulF